MQWQRKSPYHLTGDLGYRIARFRIGERVMYRPSFGGTFISMPVLDLDEAKGACEQHAREEGSEG